MTLLAGVFCRQPGDPVPDSICRALERALSRHPNETLHRYRDDRCFLVKADIGAYGSPAFHEDATGVSLLVGEPLLRSSNGSLQPRSADLERLHAAWLRDDSADVATARGVFAAAHYRKDTGALTLLTDKLGIRPMFYSVGDRYVFFATALRILEDVDAVPKVMDVRAVTEVSAFGFPLGDRTPYGAVKLLMPAEVLEVQGGTATRRQYWRMDAVAPSDRPVEELAEASFHTFMDAVAIRAGNDKTTAAFLSGGLDSRAIVMALRMRDMNVHTFNFALAGSQDQLFGAEFASRVGAIHTEAPMRPGHPAWSMMMAEAWSASPQRETLPAERPQVVWSGDGGSVVLGHVYLAQDMVDLARAGQIDAVVAMMNTRWGGEVLRRLMRPQVVEALSGASREALAEELAGFHTSDIGRALHLVLLQNDQRRHLAVHFEGIDLHRLEFALPFFDSDFMASVLRVPVDACLRHEFYMRWMEFFPEVIRSVPWQAYPGHVPCPLPMPDGLAYQWEAAQAQTLAEAGRRELLAQTEVVLRDPHFAHGLMRRPYLRLATLLHRYRVRDLGYVLRTAHIYSRYASRCRGEFTLAGR